MSANTQNRVTKGVSTAGQFAPENRPEAGVSLGVHPADQDPTASAVNDHLTAPTPATYAALRRTVPKLSRDAIDFALESEAGQEEPDPEELALYLEAMSNARPSDVGPGAFQGEPILSESVTPQRVGPDVRAWPVGMKMSADPGRTESRLHTIMQDGMAAFNEMDPANGRVTSARLKDASKRHLISMQDFARELPHLTVNESLDHYEAASLAYLNTGNWRGHLSAAADDERHYSGQEAPLDGYQPPAQRVQDGYIKGGTTVGSKYTGFRPAKDVALDVSGDLAEARAAGYLPAAATFKVGHSTKRGIQEVSVGIGGLERSSVYGHPGSSFRVVSDAGMEVERRVDLIADAYNKVDRDGADMDRGMYQTRTGFGLDG